ncbi:flavodoxin [Fructilactobacillus florum]|uniref:Flavodoxin n=1 Tax=Fructilactobacillus florum DSM 22689 = JCM 16035 TaxID=1423745 RepID=A0A0R2CUT6_9LACO|nr:flavodoxin [Fructilactobacillus florum]KRM91881.1 flavodoxin [Fructilactobacillus florum DSM 22689 = JCM 16035]
MENEKALITYYTRTENTKTVAELICNDVNGTLFPIETVTPQPNNYQTQVSQNSEEQEQNFLPNLKNKVNDFDSYKYVFIGTPTWNMALPQAVKSFLKQYDFTNKVIIPFNTNGGFGTGTTFSQIKDAATGATMLKGLSVKGGQETNGIFLAIKGKEKEQVKDEVKTWLSQIGF